MKDEQIRLTNSQLKIMQLLWEQAPITAKELTLRAADRYGWNKNTTYTILKSLVEKGSVLREEPDFLCTPAVSLEKVRRCETRGLIDKLFKGSAGMFFSAFLEDEALSGEELAALRQLIDEKK